jgi:hypothetical protein
MKHTVIIITSILLLLACEDVPKVASDNYVIEAYLFSGEEVKEVVIKTMVPLSDPEGESEIIRSALVVIKKNNESYTLTYNPATSKYRYEATDLTIVPQDFIELEVDVNGRIATGSTVMPTAPEGLQLSKSEMLIPEIKSAADFIGNNPLEDAEITMSWSNPDNELYYTVIEFRSFYLRPILPRDVQEVVDGILEDFAIISAPSTDTTFTINGALLPSYGPYVAKVYKVNQEYADLYDSETQDSRDLNEPPSNIINARGIFSGFTGDSISFEVIKK